MSGHKPGSPEPLLEAPNQTLNGSPYTQRFERVRAEMARQGVDHLLLSVGADLPYLTGYNAMPLERLTMLVLPAQGDATMVMPAFEISRVHELDEYSVLGWTETQDPIEIVRSLIGVGGTIAFGDQCWGRFVVDIVNALPHANFTKATDVMTPLRACKDAHEIAVLRAAAHAADRVAKQLHDGDIPLIGRREIEVSGDISRRLIAEGHDRVNFAIVAAGENASSPHHSAGNRMIGANEVVLCDFGGTFTLGDSLPYCSDITRCVYTGEPPSEFADMYSVLFEAQAAGVQAAVLGVTCEGVDAASRRVIADAGFGEYFTHRTGHGIGMDAHEEPYMVNGNSLPLAAGHAFSVEPGIYVSGKWGARLEDIVVATDNGPDPLNRAQHHLVVVAS